MTQNKPEEATTKNFQISELAGSKGGANIDDGQDFDPASDAVNEVGASDDDLAKNRGKGAPDEDEVADAGDPLVDAERALPSRAPAR